TRPPLSPEQAPDHVRLACVRHAASVRSEPGSNSQVNPDNPPARLSPSQQTTQANEGSSPNALSSGHQRSRTHAPGSHPKRRSRSRRKPNQEHAKLRQQALTRCRRPRIPSYRPTMSNSDGRATPPPDQGLPASDSATGNREL